MLRVITGTAKGTILQVPETGLRPATELVRGAIYSILENLTEDWDRVLDLFSGSGAMGIEALSRGAGWVDFVDRERKCCDIIKKNLEKTGFTEQAHVYCATVERALSLLDKPYSFIVVDPPYKDTNIGILLEKIANSRLIGENTIMVSTHVTRLKLPVKLGNLSLLKEHRHGDSTITVYRKENLV
ncbi:MAG: 16S rRNA (guanine(966)-N(2))-methyltransferase RsmD [Dehalococcoidales bacterium]|nr:16S rRNA (guanine(966)-N(2))-methyltransferase RsmD [Dehalococcoidales bacterium]